MQQEKLRITFKIEGDEDIQVFADPQESILNVAKQANIAIDVPCAGNGTCGKCRVKLLSGSVESPSTQHISQEEFDEGWRLACRSKAVSNAVIEIPHSALAYRTGIKVGKGAEQEQEIFRQFRSDLESMELGQDLGLEKIQVTLDQPDIQDAMADRERLTRQLQEQLELNDGELEISLHAMRKLPDALRENNFTVDCLIRKRPHKTLILNVFPSEDTGEEFPASIKLGLAVDIGTTTLAIALIDLDTGDMIAQGTAGNGQIRYGADVISRIIESGKPGGLERLRKAVIEEGLEPLIKSACQSVKVSPQSIYRMVIAGNTTMSHLFLGVNPAYLRLEPYVPAFFEKESLRGKDLGLCVHPEAEILMAPNIGSYVGGDITAGVFASMIFKKQTASLFIDLGTNGELVFGSADFLISCACSAGPAFEGGDISCGMRATDGAIESCKLDRDTMEPSFSVIGPEGTKPAGLCGSGIIDLIGELFRVGVVDARGKFVREGKRIIRDEYGLASYVIVPEEETQTGQAITIDEPDIDNFIRAKGAIFSAIRTMLAMVEYPVEAIENVYVAGGIGSGINIEQAIRIGMLPAVELEKFHYIGNSSRMGAYGMLMSRKAVDMVSETSRGITYLELSSHPGYMDEFVAACFIPHTDSSLFPAMEE